MNKRLILALKIIVMAIVVAIIAWKFHDAWQKVAAHPVHIDWPFGIIAVAAFCGSMLVSALVWRWLAWKMNDRSPTLPLLGAYTFSQLGKYFPGKVALLLMRIERADRFGMKPSICTLSTILENALYLISGALVGIVGIFRVTQEQNFTQGGRFFVWFGTIAAVVVLGAACHPRIFYTLVNRLLGKMKKPEIPASRQLTARTLALAVLAFVPCWLLGGLALWGSARCLNPLPLAGAEWFAGAFSLSVIVGMISFLPGGLVVRDAVSVAAVTIQLSPIVGHDQAVILAAVAAGLMRVFQITSEILLGALGAALTGIARQTAKEPTI